MRTARASIADFFRRWRIARDDVKRAKGARRDERQAEEFDMAREGLTHRGGSGGMGAL